jgi:cytochrome b561
LERTGISLVRIGAHTTEWGKSNDEPPMSYCKANEYSLYALLLIQPIIGLGRSLFRGAPFELFIWQVPALFAQDAPSAISS